jgi:hypothetical protein
VSELDELRTLIREVILDVLPKGLPVIETVNLSTDEDLAAFAARLLDLDAETREELREDLRAGRKRFRLDAPQGPQGPQTPQDPQTSQANGSVGPSSRRIERGAVTEKVVQDAARAGERLVLGRGAVLTPLARDRARASGVEITKED